MLTKQPLTAYQSIMAVMSLLDCSVVEDLDCDGPGTPSKSVFHLGDDAEPAAGLHGITASPSFHTLPELDQFCAAHMDQYEAVSAELERTNAYPDSWFWDVLATT